MNSTRKPSQLRQLYQQRELIWQWTLRSIVGQYRQSLLGIGWAILPPFMQMVLFSVVFGGLLQIDTGEIPYPVFSYVALVPWTFFAGGIGAATGSILKAKAMVSKIYFPRETLLISDILSKGVDFLISFAIVFLLLLLFGMPVPHTVIALPLIVLVQLLLMLGISFFTAAISVFFRDITFGISFVMQAWMYLTPVIYPLDDLPAVVKPFMWAFNPMTGLIESYRNVLIRGTWPEFLPLGLAGATGLLLCIVGYRYFKRRESLFPDIL